MLRSLNLGEKLGVSNKFVLLIFLIKCTVGAGLLYAYDGNYEARKKADVYKFYDDGGIFVQDLISTGKVSGDKMQNWNRQYDHGFSNDNRFMIVFNAILYLTAFGNVWAMMIVMNLIVVIALFQIYKVFALSYWKDRWFVYLGALIPSLMIWHSILLKEPLALIGVASLMTVFDIRISLSKRLLWMALGISVLLFIKVYLIVILLPVLVISVWRKNHISLKSNAVKYAAFLLALIICSVSFIQTNKGKVLVQSLAFKQQDFKNLAEGGIILKNDTSYCHFTYEEQRMVVFDEDSSATIKKGAQFAYFKLPNTKDSIYVSNYSGHGNFKLIFENPRSGSIVQIPAFSSDLASIIQVIPFALLNTVIYPLPFTHDPILVSLAGMENLLLIILLILSFLYRKKVVNWNLLCAALILIGGVYLLIGFTTPVLGAIVRYKSIMLPFVWYVCYLLIDLKKIESSKIVTWLKSFVLQEQAQA